MAKPIDITGEKFGKLTVLKRVGKDGSFATWLCVCDCGRETIVRSRSLWSGNTKSCGCSHYFKGSAHINYKHGQSKSKLYNVWNGLKARCFNKNTKEYQYYGARGINMCAEWKENFQSFYFWAKENGYLSGFSLDRIDNNGDYEPANCRWVTKAEQNNNKRSNVRISFKGQSKTMKQWADSFGISYKLLHSRINKLGWSFEKAISTPPRKSSRK